MAERRLGEGVAGKEQISELLLESEECVLTLLRMIERETDDLEAVAAVEDMAEREAVANTDDEEERRQEEPISEILLEFEESVLMLIQRETDDLEAVEDMAEMRVGEAVAIAEDEEERRREELISELLVGSEEYVLMLIHREMDDMKAVAEDMANSFEYFADYDSELTNRMESEMLEYMKYVRDYDEEVWDYAEDVRDYYEALGEEEVRIRKEFIEMVMLQRYERMCEEGLINIDEEIDIETEIAEDEEQRTRAKVMEVAAKEAEVEYEEREMIADVEYEESTIEQDIEAAIAFAEDEKERRREEEKRVGEAVAIAGEDAEKRRQDEQISELLVGSEEYVLMLIQRETDDLKAVVAEYEDMADRLEPLDPKSQRNAEKLLKEEEVQLVAERPRKKIKMSTK